MEEYFPVKLLISGIPTTMGVDISWLIGQTWVKTERLKLVES